MGSPYSWAVEGQKGQVNAQSHPATRWEKQMQTRQLPLGQQCSTLAAHPDPAGSFWKLGCCDFLYTDGVRVSGTYSTEHPCVLKLLWWLWCLVKVNNYCFTGTGFFTTTWRSQGNWVGPASTSPLVKRVTLAFFVPEKLMIEILATSAVGQKCNTRHMCNSTFPGTCFKKK